jgi:hypothetical protein
MQAATHSADVSKTWLWAARIISGLPVLFLLVDGVMKLVKPAPVVDATLQLGYPEGVIIPLGIVLILSTVLYVIPATSVLGAMLLTAYLGGATATHVRVGGDPFSILFPIILGLLLWFGLYLRVERLRDLVPKTNAQTSSVSKKRLWIGRVLTGIPALMLLFSGVMKLINPAPVATEFARLGYADSSALGIGIIEILCTVLYLIPHTSVLGAILLTGYLGGAVATHVRIGDPFFWPIIIAAVIWVGLFLRDNRLPALVPLRN